MGWFFLPMSTRLIILTRIVDLHNLSLRQAIVYAELTYMGCN